MIVIRSLVLTAVAIAAAHFPPAIAAEMPATDKTANKALQTFIESLDEVAIVDGPSLVGCKLSGGTETDCVKVTLTPNPTTYTPGPWCPGNIADGPDEGGIWLEGGEVYDVDGAFIENMATFYKDPTWQMFDPTTGDIKVTDSAEACAAAARPDVDPRYQNYCVQCQIAYLEEPVNLTFVIPLMPVMSETPTPLSPNTGTGVAFNGVRFDAPAPVDAILGAHTLAPLDDCGGHVNLHVGYHYHAATGCTEEVAQPYDHAPLIGIAADGVGLHTRLNADGSEPTDLDTCRGHDFGDIGYHYHVAEAGKNQIIGCFAAETGCVLDDENQTCDATVRRRRP